MPIQSILTVTAAATARSLTTMPIAKRLLGITDNSQDTTLDALIPMASAAVENYCNRVFAKETLSETIRIWSDPLTRTAARGVTALQLQRWPIVAASVAVTEDSTALVEGTDYKIDYAKGILTRLDSDLIPQWWRLTPVVVTYGAGYVLPGTANAARDLPYEIEEATVDVLRMRLAGTTRDPALRSESVPEVYSASYYNLTDMPQGVSAYAASLLEAYRVPVLG